MLEDEVIKKIKKPIWIVPTLKYDYLWDFTMSPEQDTRIN
jgi:hypothetical protein